MANATEPLIRRYASPQGHLILRDTGAAIYEGTLVAQLTSGGKLVPASTSSSGRAIGIATHSAANGAACMIETDRVVIMANASADPVTASTPIGATLYALDDHTVTTVVGTAPVLPVAGLYYGMEPDGGIRVKLSVA